ncbi:unnamed protein product [Effrenium voratum]|uniref:C2 domain-containing protein n=1 Tax=Effrenium voratum TaxID=2562239 RepID=A0AA36MUU0_9DINO|nr:unnamed protein product [Effrenium voratum]
MSDGQQLQQQLYPGARRIKKDSLQRLFVTVLRAGNLDLPGIRWYPPQAVVALGQHTRRSPLGEAFGRHPIFDWQTALPFTGYESHLVFQVVCEGRLVGSCLVPLAEVVSAAGGFRRVLPLASPRPGQPGPELSVQVTTTLEGDIHMVPAQEAAAQRLQKQTCQLRVTLRSLRIAENLSLVEGQPKIAAYVVASCGQQSARTKGAFLRATREDNEKFVFTDLPNSNFDCGDLMRGKLDKYRAAPSLEERRSSDTQYGYRLKVENGLQVSYCNVQFTFWYHQQEVLELSVFDDLFLYYPDNLVAMGSLDLTEAFRQAFTEQGLMLDTKPKVSMTVALAPSIAALRETPGSHAAAAAAAAADGGTGGSTSERFAGELELEVEFLEEPVAAVSALETTFRRAPRAQQEAEERHLDALQYLAEATGVTGGLPAPEDLFEAQRSALARLVACSAVSLARRLVAHEERVVTLFAQRLENAVQQVCEALNAPSEELLASARSAVPCESLEEAAENYKTSCRPPTVSFLERLLPLGTLLQRLSAVGALLRCSLRKAAEAVDPLRGGPFFEILERLLVAQNALAPGEIPTLQLGLSCEESLAQSRDLEAADIPGVEQQDQLRLGRAAIYSNFLPEIDCARIMDEEVEELRRQILPGHYRYILPSSLAIGAFCGALAAFSYVETAVIVHTLDERILCHQDYKHLMVMRYLCKAMTESYVDRFAEWVATSPACYKGIFLACALADGKGAFSQMRRRFLRLKELSLEPLGPPLSPHKVICASGFLRTLADLCQPWAVDADRPWTSGQVFFLRFDADCLSQLGLQLDDTLARDLKRTEAVARFLMSLTNPISFQQRAIGMLLEELGDLVDRASERADQVGKLLARQLVEAKARSRSFTASLVGYSAGGIVVESCLKELQEMVKDGQRAAADVVCDAVMLGTPVSALDEDWTALRQLVSGRFVNGFFAQDTVLLSHQFRRGGGALAGCSPLRAPDVENLPLDPFITTHSEYPEQMPLILHRIFRGL